MADLLPLPPGVVASLLASFREVSHLHNHWARSGPSVGYYWYVTFDESSDVHRLVRQCQDQLAFPYLDHVPLSGLHLTLDRIAYEGDATGDQLDTIARTSIQECRLIQPFTINVAVLSGTAGAVGLNVFPHEPMQALRRALRAATLSVLPDAPLNGQDFLPHVTVAYANTHGVPATAAVAAAERIAGLPPATATVASAAMVRLERLARSYQWHVVASIALGSASC